MTWPSGDEWVGEFKNGVIDGRGVFTSKSADCPFQYHGRCVNTIFEGEGQCR